MATVPPRQRTREVDYATSDGRPMAETDLHRDEMIDDILLLQDHFADRPNVYVSGDILLYYEEGNPRKHVAPDILVALDVPKLPPRLYYQVWKEGKSPDFVAEITSKTTRREDQGKKRIIYRDVLKVLEYFQFDPTADYLDPPLQGFRLLAGDYVPIEPVNGRIPSQVLGLHFDREGQKLRMYNPATGTRLLTRLEKQQLAQSEAQAAQREAQAAQREAEEALRRAEDGEAQLRRIADENERLRRELEALRAGRPLP